jgi:DASH complex subunit Duo1
MSHDEQNAQDEALRRELHSVRKVNEAIEGAIESLAKARNSMKVSPQCSRVDPLLL